MARKPTEPSRSRAHAKRTPKPPAIRERDPRGTRVVTARVLGQSQKDKRTGRRRKVPEIRLSGLWLERGGFPIGKRYFIGLDREYRMIFLQTVYEKESAKRRR